MAETLEDRIRRLEDIEAIRKLIVTFARGADHGCDPTILRPLFTDDAVFEVGQFGAYNGGDEIAEKMHANNKTGFYWTLHYLVSPEIHIADDGQTATAFYYLWEPAATPRTNKPDQAFWIGGWYDAKLRCEEGVWKYEHLALTLKLLSAYDEGWKDMPEGFDDLD